jgi:putative oxidoreductase
MANSDSFFLKWAPRVLSILRIVAGFLLMQHGLQKLFGVLMPPTPTGAPQEHGTFQLLSLTGVAGILESGGGLLLLLGLFTRPVAFILSGLMAFAYFMVHFHQGWYGFWPILNKGELAVIYCFVYLYFAVAGGGAWSLDSLLRRGRPSYM